MTQKHVNGIAYTVIGCAIEVHKHLGPGLLESVYQTCMIDELRSQHLEVQSQVYIPIHYKNRNLGGVLKLDLLVNNLLIVELKAVETMLPVYKAQLLSYLKLSNKLKGILINFNSENITENAVHLVTEEFAKLPKS
jgi:GxxExxY protein